MKQNLAIFITLVLFIPPSKYFVMTTNAIQDNHLDPKRACKNFDYKLGEYFLATNGSVYIPSRNAMFVKEYYNLTRGILTVCVREEFDEDASIDFSHKNESLLTCSAVDLKPDEYTITTNGSIYVAAWEKTYTKEHYNLVGYLLTVCLPKEVEDGDIEQRTKSNTLQLFNIISLGVSMTFLVIHLVIFCVVRKMRNLPGFNLASLCMSLFLTYVIMMTNHAIKNVRLKSDNVVEETACVVSAALMHFFFLSSFVWMSIISLDVFKTIILSAKKLRLSSKDFKIKLYLLNCLIAWGITLTFTSAALLTDYLKSTPDSFRPDFRLKCWFKSTRSTLTFFVGPAFILIILNFCLFGFSAFSIHRNRMKRRLDDHIDLKKRYLVYCKLAVIMGVTWIIAALAPIFNAIGLWYISGIFNTLQSFFIFITFTCNKHSKQLMREKVLDKIDCYKRNLTPTFQLYVLDLD